MPQIVVPLTPEERQLMTQAARKAGLSLEDWLQSLALRAVISGQQDQAQAVRGGLRHAKGTRC